MIMEDKISMSTAALHLGKGDGGSKNPEISDFAVKETVLDGVEALVVEEKAGPNVDTIDRRNRRPIREDYTYAAKKTVAQGMMDVALITANANQLRYLVEYQRQSPTFWINVTLIVVSLLLQVAVGVSLIFKGRFDLKGQGKSRQAKKINNYVVVGVFLITIINVFIAAFSVTGPTPSSPSSSSSSSANQPA